MIQNNSFMPIRRIKKTSLDTINKDDYDVNLRSSLNSNKKNSILTSSIPIQKIQTNASFSMDKINRNSLQLAKTSVLPSDLKKDQIKLPILQRRNTLNPQISPLKKKSPSTQQRSQIGSQRCQMYYQKKLQQSLLKHETTYMMNLYRQHFNQCIEVLRFGKEFKVSSPKKVLNLYKKNPQFKTIFLDLDQTLIHCDQRSNNFTVKLNFPVDKGGIIQAGVRIRAFCKEFLQQLSQFAQIIIFTASSASYADVILDYLDPNKQLIAHRMYRQNCTLQKGFYLKDLRTAGRPLQSSALVDNSAYCHILQPENAIPIVPFFHFSKDRQLESLLEYLKILVQQKDMRTMLKQTFFYSKYLEDTKDARKIFLNNIPKMQQNFKQKVNQQKVSK